MKSWERSQFSTTPEELEIEEAVRAMERILGSPIIAGKHMLLTNDVGEAIVLLPHRQYREDKKRGQVQFLGRRCH